VEILLSVAIGVIFGTSVYLMLRGSILRLALGLVLIAHGANLLLFTMGGLRKGSIPILGLTPPEAFTDPLVQALILTAIVISFGVTAVMLVVVFRMHQADGTDAMEDLRRLRG
jgi:multicomponent Na+:H+ antiporter subunit C